MAAKQQAIDAMETLKPFIGPSQIHALVVCMRGEEKGFFYGKLVEYAERVKAMPKTYEQDGLGDKAIVHLHYFKGGCDWFITEKDSDPDGDGQIQAFGLCDLGYGAELGYVSIQELIENEVELDLYWEPKTLEQVRASHA